MPATPAAALHEQQKAASPTAPSTPRGAAQNPQTDENKLVRLHITPFTPALLTIYLAPSVRPLAENISYHHVETFPDKGFGYVELPAMEAHKLKKKLNGSTLKGSKVSIEEAKPEKRKAGGHADVEEEDKERSAKRAKKRAKKEEGVLEGVELREGRKVKRGWTEVPVKGKKDRKEKQDKDKDKGRKSQRKESKYTKEPEVLFKAKLTPVAATELARKDKKQDKKKSKTKHDVVVHEFEKNAKQPSFLKVAKVSTDKKPAVEYVNGKGWVDEDGNVVEAETGKARKKRVLELADAVPEQPSVKKQPSSTPCPKSSPAPTSATKEKNVKVEKATPSPASSQSDSDESSVISSSSDEDSTESDADLGAEADTSSTSPVPGPKANTPGIAVTPSSPAKKEVHPFEALFKPKSSLISTPDSNPASTPARGLAPINTSFSFFDNNVNMDVEQGDNLPITPYTQRDLEWRGLRSAAPTPDTAAIGRRFSFPWRKSSQEADEDDEAGDAEAAKQLTNNTKANASSAHLPGVAEEDEDEDKAEREDAVGGAEQDGEVGDDDEEEEEKPESEFRKWFWENQGSLNRAWKKRRRDALKAKRLSDNKWAVGGRRAV